MAEGISVVVLDGALCGPTIIGHWKLVIGHLLRRIRGSVRESSGLEYASAGGPARLRSGGLAARAARCLPLLPSGPGGVHRATLRETRSSTPREPSGAHSTRDYTNAKPRVCERISESSPSAFFSPGKSRGYSHARNPATISSHTLSFPFEIEQNTPVDRPRPEGGWRRGRDSNPGWSFPHTRSPGVLLQPLGHLSAECPQCNTDNRQLTTDNRSSYWPVDGCRFSI